MFKSINFILVNVKKNFFSNNQNFNKCKILKVIYFYEKNFFLKNECLWKQFCNLNIIERIILTDLIISTDLFRR